MSEIFKDTLALGNDRLFDKRSIYGVDPFKHLSGVRGKFPVTGVLLEEITDEYGRTILEPVDANIIVVGGGIFTLEKITGQAAAFEPSTLNQILNINADVPGNFANSVIAGFCVGTGGSGLEFGSVVAPDMKQRDIKDMVPIRYGTAVTGDDASKYFMKKANADGTTYSWYMKELAEPPVIHTQWKNSIDPDGDGTEITSDIWNSSNTEGIESYAEFKISLNTNDVHEYFEATNQLGMARYNTIGFYLGEKKALSGGGTDYVGTRLFSVITFNNRDVSVKTASTYRYRIYSLI